MVVTPFRFEISNLNIKSKTQNNNFKKLNIKHCLLKIYNTKNV